MDFELTTHAKEMLRQRYILEEWVLRTTESPDWKTVGSDNNIHYFKMISEFENRVLHVIINPCTGPRRVITAFFDRKARKLK